MRVRRGVIRAASLHEIEFLNCVPISLENLKNRPVLLCFFDYATLQCLRMLSYVKIWHGRYADKGLWVLGIHSPRFRFGRDATLVRRALDDLGITFPVANDPEHAVWEAYSNVRWPALYLIDPDGYLRFMLQGPGDLTEAEKTLQELVKEVNPRAPLPEPILPLDPELGKEPCALSTTPEVFLGYSEGRIGNVEGFSPGKSTTYASPTERTPDVYYAEGTFESEADAMVFQGTGSPGTLSISYVARGCYAVAAPPEGRSPVGLIVEQDGRPLPREVRGESVSEEGGKTVVAVDYPKLLHLVENRDCARHLLSIRISDPGTRVYALSFSAE